MSASEILSERPEVDLTANFDFTGIEWEWPEERGG